MDNKFCTIGDLKLRIVSMVTDKQGYINIVAVPSIKIMDNRELLEDAVFNNKKAEEPREAIVTEKILEAIQYFIDVRKQQFPNFQVVRNAKVEDAVIPIWKLIKKGYSEDIIIECIRIGAKDEFWKRNLMTLTQLNKKCKDELTKFEHLLMIYEEKKGKKTKYIDEPGISYEEL